MSSASPASEKKPSNSKLYESDGEDSETFAPGNRRRRQQQSGNLVTSTASALENIGSQTLHQQANKKNDTLRLRLDLNLDIEITLKAKIQGNLELALLET